MARTGRARSGLAHKLYVGEVSYDFVGKKRRWYLFSAVLILISVGALLLNGLNLGIEFKGGASFQVSTPVQSDSVERAKQALGATALPDLNDVNAVTVGSNIVKVQTRTLGTDEVPVARAALAKEFNVPVDQVAYSLVGKSWGDQITEKGLWALVIFLALVMLMIWAYFRDWKMSIAAIVALLHDLVVTVGVYALVGFTVTPATLIGVLTILGYSLYDTVVVFDKVRENVRDLSTQSRSYSSAANTAVNQVLVRSLNTTIIGVLPVAALLFAGVFVLGQGPLEDLGLALFVGMITGAYSSIFIATPLLTQMREAEPAMAEHRAHLVRREGKRAARSGKGPKGSAHRDASQKDATQKDATQKDATQAAAKQGAEKLDVTGVSIAATGSASQVTTGSTGTVVLEPDTDEPETDVPDTDEPEVETRPRVQPRNTARRDRRK